MLRFVASFLLSSLGFAWAQNADCTLIVPDNPLSASGLATPYRLTATVKKNGPCNELNAAQSAFVQAAVLDPQTGQISVYSPLVIDKGSKPAVDPVKPKLPDGAVVAIWFGFNGDNLTLDQDDSSDDDDHSRGHQNSSSNPCVNGVADTVFGQFAYCNAPAFFQAANKAIHDRKLVVAPLGVASDGRACPTTRDFSVVDQDPSDNLQTTYLNINGRIAQDTASNLARFPGAVRFANPSDERLVTALLDPALGCASWTAPNLADGGRPVPALALNELQADAYQLPPVAFVPQLDPMALIAGAPSRKKLNAYRVGVDQPTVDKLSDADPVLFCSDLVRVGLGRLALDKTIFAGRPSPFPLQANSLFTFLAQRFVASYQILTCPALLHAPAPVALKLDVAGVVIDAVIGR